MEKQISIGLLGLGVVGSGVIKIIADHQEELFYQLGQKVKVEKVLVHDMEKAREIEINQDLLTQDSDDVLDNPDIDVIIEVMGNVEPARDYILQALQAKKHVVTTNLDLIALYGQELERTARENDCDLFYEASVGGGIPLLRTLADGFVSDRIYHIMGILNGTTNYILTKMNTENKNYQNTLQKAQKLGFAKVNPTEDVEGFDVAKKMIILARLCLFANVKLDDVNVKGISQLSLTDLQYAKQLGYTIKLIGFANQSKDHVEVSVEPILLSNNHPLASVKDENNAVYVRGENVGETMFYGPGSGSLATATAVMSDVVAISKNIILGTNGKTFMKSASKKKKTSNNKKFSKFYIRLHVEDEMGAFAIISELFNQVGISFERILQKPSSKNNLAEIVVVTHATTLALFLDAIAKLNELYVAENINSFFRVEGDAKQ